VVGALMMLHVSSLKKKLTTSSTDSKFGTLT